MSRFGRIDALVNNAVRIKGARLEKASAEDWNATIAVGLTGVSIAARRLGV